MCLRSYHWNASIDMERIWSLFKHYLELDCECTCSLEIVEAAIKGRIPLDKLDGEGDVIFDLERYVHKFDKHRRMEKSRYYKRVKYLANDIDEADGSGVFADAISSMQITGNYENIIDNCELEWALKCLDEKVMHFMVCDKVNIKVALIQANKGVPESIALIKKLVDKYPFMDELLHIILGCGRPLEEVLL